MADLVAGLARVEPALASAAAKTLCERPATYDLDDSLVPATKILVGIEDVAASEAVAILRKTCLHHLDARIALALDPPADWRRDAKLGCKCRDCSALAAFLDNPNEKLWLLAAAEQRRNHVEATIRAARSDVTTTTERRGSPYKLLCTKNQASHARRCRQRDQDLEAAMTLRASR